MATTTPIDPVDPLAPTVQNIVSHWWVPLLRGVIAIAFGITLFAFPITAVGVFVLFFGAFAFVDGVLAIYQALRFAHPSSGRWWLQLISGLAGIAVGVITVLYPGLTAYTLGLFIAAWAIVTGVLEIGAGIRLRQDVPGEIFMILAGIVSIILGIVLFFFPLAALLAWVWVVGTYALIAGVVLIMLAFRLRNIEPKTTAPAA
jgi:uncharacterized membrane protein HdeD (DUF308 family)